MAVIPVVFSLLTLAVAVLHGLFVHHQHAEYAQEMRKALDKAAEGPSPRMSKRVGELEDSVISLQRLQDNLASRIVDVQESLDSRFNRLTARESRDRRAQEREEIHAQIMAATQGQAQQSNPAVSVPGAVRIAHPRIPNNNAQ